MLILSYIGYECRLWSFLSLHVCDRVNMFSRISAEYLDSRVDICFSSDITSEQQKSKDTIMTAPMRPYNLSLFAQRIHRA
jgi:hypothetical protein